MHQKYRSASSNDGRGTVLKKSKSLQLLHSTIQFFLWNYLFSRNRSSPTTFYSGQLDRMIKSAETVETMGLDRVKASHDCFS